MKDIRNADGHRVAVLDEQADAIEIRVKGCVTTIIRQPDGTYEVVNNKSA